MQLHWPTLKAQVAACQNCALCNTRTNTVFGEGNIDAEILFVGEGPGREEDLQGRPFVGPAGQLLDKMLASVELDRTKVYIANIVKCRPPQNRVPLEDEALACLPYLRAQTGLIKPKIIVCLGATAAKYIYDRDVRITKERGIWKEKKGVWIIPTYHPAALLRDPDKKKESWEDLKSIQARYIELGQDGCAVQAP